MIRAFYLRGMMMLALVSVLLGCTGDEINTLGTGCKRMMTFHVSTPYDNSPKTRIAYNDTKLELTWQTGDKLAVLGFAENVYKSSEDYFYSGEDGATSGDFTGLEIDEATSYNIYYPNSITVAEGAGIVSLNMDGQTQIGNNNTDHLRNYILLEATGITDLNYINLKMKSSILKFELSNIPVEIGTLDALVWETETDTETKSTTLNLKDIALENQSLTAYLSFMPEEMSVKTGGIFTVTLIGSVQNHKASIKVEDGKEYKPGNRYTATISDWEPVIEIGDFLMKDGSLVGKDKDLTIAQKANCIGIVFWVGDPSKDDKALQIDHPSCTHGLVVSLTEFEEMIWQENFRSISEWLANQTELSNKYVSLIVEQDGINLNKILGYNHTCVLDKFNDDEENSNYLANSAAKIKEFRDSEKGVTPSNTSNWYFPSVKELSLLCSGEVNITWKGSYTTEIYNFINGQLSQIPEAIQLTSSGSYSSSSEDWERLDQMIYLQFHTGSASKSLKFYKSCRLRPVLAF